MSAAAPLRFDQRAGSSGGAPLRVGVGAPEDVIEAARRRGVLLPADYYAIRQADARAMAFTVSGLSALEQLQAVKDSLDAAFAAGESFSAWRRRALIGDVALSLPAGRLETIFRTNMQTAYMVGRGAQVEANVSTHPFLMYTAVNDSRTRPAHHAMHGTIRAVDDQWWRTHRPPNGFNCRCSVVALTQAEAERRGITAITPNAQPDPGFEFDPWNDRMEGIRGAIEKFRGRAAGPLADEAALLAARATPPVQVRTLDEALAHGKAETLRLLGEVDRAIGTPGMMDRSSIAAADRFSAALQSRIAVVHGNGIEAVVAGKFGLPGAVKTVKAAAMRYPASWVRATNEFGDLFVRGIPYGRRSRADHVTNPFDYAVHAKNGNGRLTLQPRAGLIRTRAGDMRVALHEFGHRIQAANPALDAIFQAYHARRTTGESLQQLRRLVPGVGYGVEEVAMPDKFLDPYFGRVYPGGRGALEMLTMTLERMLANNTDGLLVLYQSDRELFELAVGLLTGWMP